MVQETTAGSAQPFIRNAISAIRCDNISRARALLVEATDREPANGLAWLWRAGVAESPVVRRFCLERVLAVEPEHPIALRALAATPSDEESTNTPRSWRRPSPETEHPVQTPAYQAMQPGETAAYTSVSAAVALRAVYVEPPASDTDAPIAPEPVQQQFPLLERVRRSIRPARKAA